MFLATSQSEDSRSCPGLIVLLEWPWWCSLHTGLGGLSKGRDACCFEGPLLRFRWKSSYPENKSNLIAGKNFSNYFGEQSDI